LARCIVDYKTNRCAHPNAPFASFPSTQLPIPVLVVTGENTIPLHKLVNRELAGLLPRVKSVTITGAGHGSPRENSAAFKGESLQLAKPDRWLQRRSSVRRLLQSEPPRRRLTCNSPDGIVDYHANDSEHLMRFGSGFNSTTAMGALPYASKRKRFEDRHPPQRHRSFAARTSSRIMPH